MTATTKPPRKSKVLLIVVAIFAAILTLLSAAVLIYLWITLGDRGLYADATGTDGYTTPLEAFVLVGGISGLVVFPTTFVVFILMAIRRRA